MVQLCLGGKAAGGSLPVDDLSSAWSATKSLYRLLTVHVRMGVDTAHQCSGPMFREAMVRSLTLDSVGGVRFRLCHRLGGRDDYVLDV